MWMLVSAILAVLAANLFGHAGFEGGRMPEFATITLCLVFAAAFLLGVVAYLSDYAPIARRLYFQSYMLLAMFGCGALLALLQHRLPSISFWIFIIAGFAAAYASFLAENLFPRNRMRGLISFFAIMSFAAAIWYMLRGNLWMMIAASAGFMATAVVLQILLRDRKPTEPGKKQRIERDADEGINPGGAGIGCSG